MMASTADSLYSGTRSDILMNKIYSGQLEKYCDHRVDVCSRANVINELGCPIYFIA